MSEPYYSQRARSVCVSLSAFFISGLHRRKATGRSTAAEQGEPRAARRALFCILFYVCSVLSDAGVCIISPLLITERVKDSERGILVTAAFTKSALHTRRMSHMSHRAYAVR